MVLAVALNSLFIILLSISPVMAWVLRVCVEYTKLDELESYFSENRRECDNKRYWHRNRARDKFKRTSLIAVFFSCRNGV